MKQYLYKQEICEDKIEKLSRGNFKMTFRFILIMVTVKPPNRRLNSPYFNPIRGCCLIHIVTFILIVSKQSSLDRICSVAI